MNINVSTCVGFAALFGVSIMNGVLMVRSITAHRQDGMERRAAILQGAPRLPAADPAGVAGGDPGLVARVAGDRPGLGRAAAARDGDRVGII